MPKLIDETGNRYGRLIVIERAENVGKQVTWCCLCDCGASTIVHGGNLRSGNTTSCGCFSRECATKHGDSDTPEYHAWKAVKGRCDNPKDAGWKNYGGRGITICDRWLESFDNFLEDMGRRPTPDYTLDRIDNDLGYCPENCRWATRTQQQRNTRINRMITHDGRTMCLAAWAEEAGMSLAALRQRLLHGWSMEKALTTPLRLQSTER